MMNDGLLTTTRTEDAGTVRLRQAEAALAATQERLRRSQELGGAYPYELDFKTRTLVAAPGLGPVRIAAGRRGHL